MKFQEVAVDESTGSVTLRAEFPNPDGMLLPGMYVRAVLDEAVNNAAILAPQQGVTRDPKGNATALVLTADNKVEQRTLVDGARDRRSLADQPGPGRRAIDSSSKEPTRCDPATR